MGAAVEIWKICSKFACNKDQSAATDVSLPLKHYI